MPQDRKSDIRADLVDAQRQLLEVVDRVGADEWSRVSPRNEGWTVQQILTHLATAESGFVPALRRMASGQGGVPTDFDPDRWNAGQLRRRADQTPAQVRAELEKSYQDLLALLDGLDEAALDRRGRLSTGVEGSTEDNFRLVARHKRGHTEDIRAALLAARQT